jgi:hypothetical protein
MELLIPETGAIPVHWSLFEILNVFTFILHIIMMNVVVGGAIYLLASKSKPLENSLRHKLPSFLAFTVNFAVAPLLFLQVIYGSFIYTSFVLSAGWLMLIIPVVILAYYGLYFNATKPNGIILNISVVLLLLIGFIISNVVTQMYFPQGWSSYAANGNGWSLVSGSMFFWSKFLHVIISAPAIGGLFVALLWNYRKNHGTAGAEEHIAKGMKLFTHTTLLQLAIGSWFLMAMPREVMRTFMGQNMPATIIFSLSLVAAMLSIVFGLRGKPVITTVFALLTIITMSINRAFMRAALLKPHFSPESLPVTGDYSSFILFLVTFVIGLAAVAYMLRTWWISVKEA